MLGNNGGGEARREGVGDSASTWRRGGTKPPPMVHDGHNMVEDEKNSP